MKDLSTVFPRRKNLIIVIHAETIAQTLRNAKIAFECGADGIFLIGHQIAWTLLLGIYKEVRAAHPNAWIGINFLDLGPVEAFDQVPVTVSGIWVDNAGVTDNDLNPTVEAKRIHSARMKFDGLYFGGVAFKGQRPIHNPARAAHLAVPFMDVVTTSGPATGFAPDLEKIATMKRAIDPCPLGNASGITVENVAEYLPYVDYFLVATGVNAPKSSTEYDPEKITMLAAQIHSYQPA